VLLDQGFFGDGCIRLGAPLSPAIHLGADRLVAIGLRHLRTPHEERLFLESPDTEAISIADVAGVVMNSLFLGSLETDVERLLRINKTVRLVGKPSRTTLRRLPVVVVRPSRDLGLLASERFADFPVALRHLLRGIGASTERGWDVVSYLAFGSAFATELLALGYEDALRQRDEFARLFDGQAPVA
jgi:NTE family protein